MTDSPTDSEVQAYGEVLQTHLRRQLLEAVAASDALHERLQATDRAYWHARRGLYEQARAAVKRLGAVATIEALQDAFRSGRVEFAVAVECIAVVKGIAYGMKVTEYLDSESAFSWIKRRQETAGSVRE